MNKPTQLPQKLMNLDAYIEMKEIVESDQVKICLKELNIQKIESEASLEIVKTNTQHLKKIVKSISKIRLDHTKKLDDKKKEYMNLEKSLIKPIEDVIDSVSKITADFLLEQQKKKEAELKELQAAQLRKEQFTSSLFNYTDNFFKDLKKAFKNKSLEELNILFRKYLKESISNNYTQMVHEYEDRKSEIDITRDYMITAGKAVNAYIKDLDSKKSVENKIKNIAESLQLNYDFSLQDVGEVEEQKINEISASSASISKGTYFKIDYNVINIGMVPKEYLKTVVDHDKIEMFKNQNKNAIGLGKIGIPGIKFLVETKIRG